MMDRMDRFLGIRDAVVVAAPARAISPTARR
jgi:hypothetical protein